MAGELESTSRMERIVLCCLVNLQESGSTPANTAEIRSAVADRTADVDHIGRVDEARVIRALNGLSESALVAEHRPEETSPVGKGRSEYTVDGDVETLREALEDDDSVSPLLE